jgi:hypothetical protein
MATTVLDTAPNLGALYAKAAATAFGRGGDLPDEALGVVRRVVARRELEHRDAHACHPTTPTSTIRP